MLRVRVSPELIERLLVTGAEQRATRVRSGIPDGAVLSEVYFDWSNRIVDLLFSHPDYEGEHVDVSVVFETRDAPQGWESV